MYRPDQNGKRRPIHQLCGFGLVLLAGRFCWKLLPRSCKPRQQTKPRQLQRRAFSVWKIPCQLMSDEDCPSLISAQSRPASTEGKGRDREKKGRVLLGGGDVEQSGFARRGTEREKAGIPAGTGREVWNSPLAPPGANRWSIHSCQADIKPCGSCSRLPCLAAFA